MLILANTKFITIVSDEFSFLTILTRHASPPEGPSVLITQDRAAELCLEEYSYGVIRF